MRQYQMMQEGKHKDAVGAILFDVAASSQVGHDWFVPEYWRERNALRIQSGGRGGVAIITTPIGECVLRHYRRGGLVATLLGDHYLWLGAERSRPFEEFRLLADINRLGLPAPAVVAARYCRRGMFYTADLITRRIADAQTLAECLKTGALTVALAQRVGAVIARFHKEGVWHADLNAHNVLVSPGGIYLIDFDRSRLREPANDWQQANLQRLRRSLVKLGAADQGDVAFDRTIWQPLLLGYGQNSNS